MVLNEVKVGPGLISATVFLSIIVQSIPIDPKRIPGKVFIFTLCMTGALIFYSYNAGLVSLLSVETFWYPITSMEVSSCCEMSLLSYG
jgi:hypothetical protein